MQMDANAFYTHFSNLLTSLELANHAFYPITFIVGISKC